MKQNLMINQVNKQGTALHLAAVTGNEEIIEILLKSKADPE